MNKNSINQISYQNEVMAQYWIKIIREKRDHFRNFVTDPALFSKLDSLGSNLIILDACCGEGYVSRYLSDKGHKVVGVDLSKPLLDAANQSNKNGESFTQGNVCQLAFPDNCFDAIVSNFAIMEMEDPELAIRELSRVLKVGGRLILQGLHPTCFTPNSGKTNGQQVSKYFESQRFSEKFIVDGLESPEEVVRYHHPLKTYKKALKDNHLAIIDLDEPEPIESTPEDHPIREIFEEPWVLLIEAQKYLPNSLKKKDLCTVYNKKGEPTKKHLNPIKFLEKIKDPGILKFIIEILHLKDIYRRGWLLSGRDIPHEKGESDADHSFGVAILSLFLASEYYPELDLEKVVIMAMIHELGEIHNGDIAPRDKDKLMDKHEKEKQGVIYLLSQLTNGQKYINIWLEFEEKKTPEAIFVKQIDKLEMIIQSGIYSQHYQNTDLKVFLERNGFDVELIELKSILDGVAKMYRNKD